MNNLNPNPAEIKEACTVLKQNGIDVYLSPFNGQYAIVTKHGRYDGFTEFAIFEMARNLKTKETNQQ